MGDMDKAHNPDRLPDTSDLSGPCPRCGRTSTYSQITEARIGASAPSFRAGMQPLPQPGREASLYQLDPEQAQVRNDRVVVLQCAYCRGFFIVVEQYGEDGFRGVHWWPPPGAGLPPDGEVPPKVAAAFDEGQRCVGVNAPHAAAAMFRTALSYIVEDKGSAQAKGERDLADKIRVMAAQPEFALVSDWMTHVRLYGNAGAHPDIFGDVGIDEAREVGALLHSMIEVLYVTPARIKAREAARRADGR